MAVRKFVLLKDILDYKEGYKMTIYNNEGWLGIEGEFKIPIKIILENPKWFKEV